MRKFFKRMLLICQLSKTYRLATPGTGNLQLFLTLAQILQLHLQTYPSLAGVVGTLEFHNLSFLFCLFPTYKPLFSVKILSNRIRNIRHHHQQQKSVEIPFTCPQHPFPPVPYDCVKWHRRREKYLWPRGRNTRSDTPQCIWSHHKGVIRSWVWSKQLSMG